MRILFLSRKFPPQVGGMEMHSYFLHKHLLCEKDVILLKRSQKNLWWFLPYAFFRALFFVWRCDIIYITDGLLAPLAYVLKIFSGKPVVVTVHGLDITYPNFFYQLVNVRCLRRLDGFVAISESTCRLAVQYGCSRDRIVVIPNGVDVERFSQEKIFSDHGEENFFVGEYANLRHKQILFTQGRLVRRKGVLWFMQAVLPHLPPAVVYVIAGTGPLYKEISETIQEQKLSDRVFLLGKIPDDFSVQLFSESKVFVMPNIPVAGDYEGFGIVALEAAACGAVVVASHIEGISSAVHDGKNGYLVPSGDAEAFRRVICDILDHESQSRAFRLSAAHYTREHFRWEAVARRYEAFFSSLL